MKALVMGDVEFGVPPPSRFIRRLVALLVSVLALFVLGVALTALPSRAERLSDFQPRFSHPGLVRTPGCGGVSTWMEQGTMLHYKADQPPEVMHRLCRNDLTNQGWSLVSRGSRQWLYEKRGSGVACVVSRVAFYDFGGESRIAVSIKAPIFHPVWRGR